MDKSIISISIVLIIVAGIGGFFLGQMSMNKYKEAVDFLYPEVADEVFSISGEITSINGNSFVVETTSLERFLPGEESQSTPITVDINEQTKIYETSFSSENPEQISEKILSISDLSIGQVVDVSSSENIKGKSEIIATEIKLFNTQFS